MLRDKSLVPLSHQHQHALALCVQIDRALKSGHPDLDRWQAEAERLFRDEIRYHFDCEEQVLFPAAAKAGLGTLVDELLVEHGLMRKYVAAAGKHALTMAEMQVFAETLSAHIRKEERQLFEEMQKVLPAPDLAALGTALDDCFRRLGMPGATCTLR